MTTATYSRRDFIKVVSIAGGGLMLGFRLPSREEAILETAPALFEPNAWLRIDPSGTVSITVARSEMGQGVLTAMPMIVAEELEADWNMVKPVQADAHPTKYGNMTTGGSFSVRGWWEPLRKAGATAREMLISAAALRWNVDRSSCRAEQGRVIHTSGRKLMYGQLATDAAKLPVPTEVPLKDPKNFRILGTRMPRIDTPAKVYGSAVFCSDVRIPGMLYASIERSPTLGGTVASFDATKAKALRGVREVVHVETGVAVVADSTYAAFKGREALEVKWNEGRYGNQSSEAIWAEFKEAAKTKGTTDNYEGDAEAALATAVTIVDAVYEAPFVAHATMEPMVCVADVRNDRCEIWAPTQAPQGAQNEAARILNLPIENVHVHVTLLGGGFGRRLQNDYVADAVRVSKAIGRPVQVVWTRADDMRNDFYRPATYNVLRAGLGKDGLPVAWLHRIVGPSSRGLVVAGSTPPYAIPNFVVDFHIRETGVPIGSWRSVGPSQNGFVVESFIDELAHAAKKDPFEYRRQLLGRSPRLRRTLEYVAEKAGWSSRLPPGVGRGIAAVESFGSAAAQVAEVSIGSDGSVKIHRIVCAVDCGPVVNPDTIEAQLEGAIAYGLSAALKDEITIERGRIVQDNFDNYRIYGIRDMPEVEVHIVPSTEPVGGIGEPALPPATPAVCNAIFAATGKRIRKLPIRTADLK